MAKAKWDPIYSDYLQKISEELVDIGFKVTKRFNYKKSLRALQVNGLIGPALHITIGHRKLVISNNASWTHKGTWWMCSLSNPASYTQVVNLFKALSLVKQQLNKSFQAGSGHPDGNAWDCGECYDDYI